MNKIEELVKIGDYYTRINDFPNAIKFLEKANKLSKNNIKILLYLAGAYRSLGKFDKSINLYYEIIKLDHKNTIAHRLISSLTNYKKNKEHLFKMEELAKNEKLEKDEYINLYFALGKAYSDVEDYESSFKYYNLGNKYKKEISNFNFSILSEHFKQIRNVFKSLNFSKIKKKKDSRKILFICGMPRSGTTLVEQIISTHDKVYGGGELQFFPQIINKYFVKNYELNLDKILNEINNNKNNIAEEYFRMLKNHNTKKEFITDKMLQNFKWIGIIKIFLPNSKIIHCHREPKDNFLSIYRNNFNDPSMNWTNNEKDIILYYEFYRELMDYWDEKFPDDILHLKYENLIDNYNYEIKRILEYCELSNDNKCYEFYNFKKTPIQTASALQARKPIYKTSLNSFNLYSKYLKNFSEYFKKIKK